jgi:ADP-dependent phosphofructokinase/glucokinase
MSAPNAWPESYAALIRRLPALAADARLTIGGFSACIDVYLSLHDVLPTLRAEADSAQARDLLDELERRATRGIGGELAVEWPDGPAWIDRHVSGRRGIGGTSVQAAQMLALLGAPALVALADRSAAQLAVIHPDVLVAGRTGIGPRSSIRPTGQPRPPHCIFEYTAGEIVAGEIVPRSTRTIVRFAHSELQRDPDFDRLSAELATTAGAGIVCGFNEVPVGQVGAEIDYAAGLAREWRRRGLRLVHMEIGDFADRGARNLTIERMAPVVSSIGMSLSELAGFAGSEIKPERAALDLAQKYGLDRVCIHADEWAFAVTRGDPEPELEALQTGCLLASTRAAAGYFSVPGHLPDSARFRIPPLPLSLQQDGWSLACCPAPYLEKPAATIGLGDTFLAGTLLVLGSRSAAVAPPLTTSSHRPRLIEDSHG